LALSSVFIPSKSDNLVYTILPTSLALFIASILIHVISQDILLLVSGLIVTLGTVSLWITEPDINSLVIKTSKTACELGEWSGLVMKFYAWDLFLKKWKNRIENPPDYDFSSSSESLSRYFDDQLNNTIDSVVRDPLGRTKLTKVRMLWYLPYSLPLMIGSLFGVIGDLLELLHMSLIVALILITEVTVIKTSSKEWISAYPTIIAIAELFQFRLLLPSEATYSRSEFSKGILSDLRALLEEIESHMIRGNWTMFLSHWKGVSINLEDRGLRAAKESSESDLYKIWGEFLYSPESVDVQTKFRWLLHNLHPFRIRFNLLEGFLVEHLTETLSNPAFLDNLSIDFILSELMPEMIYENTVARNMLWPVVKGLGLSYGMDIVSSLRILIQCIVDDKYDFDRVLASQIILRYCEQVFPKPIGTSLWSDTQDDSIVQIVEILKSTAAPVITHFMIARQNPRDIITLLSNDVITVDHLKDDKLRDQARKQAGATGEKSEIEEIFKNKGAPL